MKSKNLIDSFKYAFTGIFTALKKERNLKVDLCIAILVVIAGVILKISKLEWFICIILFAIVISAELFNTSIEIIVNMITTKKDENAKDVKDIAAGAVLITAIASAIIGLIIFIPKIINLIKI